MAYSDKWHFEPGPVRTSNYSDGTVIPRLAIAVTRNGEPWGEIEVHLHRVKYAPHASVGVTSRVGPETEE